VELYICLNQVPVCERNSIIRTGHRVPWPCITTGSRLTSWKIHDTELWMLNENSGQPIMNLENNKVQNNTEKYSVFILPCKSNQNANYTPRTPCIIFFKIAVDVNYIYLQNNKFTFIELRFL